MTTSTARMAALLAALRREQNGVVAESMASRGIRYPLNLGVALPTIRTLAAPFAPDTPLARLLYRQQVRELRIAALRIADPAEVGEADLPFWMEGITNGELAEQAALFLSRTPVATAAVRAALASDDRTIVYLGLMTAARLPHPDPTPLLDAVRRLLTAAVEDSMLVRGAVALLVRLASSEESCRESIEALADRTKAATPLARSVADELAWRLRR